MLTCIAIVCVLQWYSSRKSTPLILGALLLLAAGACLLWDEFVETPAEKVTKYVYDLAHAFQKEDADKTLSYISPRCRSRVSIGMAVGKVKVKDDLRISDVHVRFREANSVAITHFRANASVSAQMAGFTGDFGYQPSRWELEWQKEAGDWKVIEVKRLNPITGKEVGFFAAE